MCFYANEIYFVETERLAFLISGILVSLGMDSMSFVMTNSLVSVDPIRMSTLGSSQ